MDMEHPLGALDTNTVPPMEKSSIGNHMMRKRMKRNKPPRPYLMTGDLFVALGVTYRCHKQCHNKTPRPYLMIGDLLVALGVTYRRHKQHNVTLNHRDHT